MALACGADLVLELPVSAATASAEFFAGSGVTLLDQLGIVDGLCFGCEDGDTPLFEQLAPILVEQPAGYQKFLREALKKGLSFPAARSRALTAYIREAHPTMHAEAVETFLSKPNNLLGLEYQKAMYRLGSSIRPLPLARKGSGYHEAEFQEQTFASATAIRRLLLSGGARDEGTDCAAEPAFPFRSDALSSPAENEQTESLCSILPEAVVPLVADAMRQGSYVEESDLDLLLQYALLSNSSGDFTGYLDVSEALSNRIWKHLNQYEGFHGFAEHLKSRELTHTRIQRGLLHILLGIKKTPAEIPYARVLGFRREATPLLSLLKKESSIPLLSKLADAGPLLSPYGQELLEETTRASNIYESILTKKTGQPFRHEYQKPIVIL
jgi:predicted nucleotidyltransferase